MCRSTCQACPDIWKTSVDGPPIRATATISLVESELPAVRHETVAAVAIAAIRATGSSQSAPRTMPMIMAIGTWTHSTAIKVLLVVSRNLTRSSLSMLISRSLRSYFEKQAATACGSIASQAPAWRSRVTPSCPSGRTTRSDGTAVILTIAAPAEAAATMVCCVLHHGGKATATTSAPGRACNDSAATAIKLAASNPAAFSQSGHRDFEMVFPRSMERN